MHHKALWPITKKANRGFRGYPVGTIAFYGPDDRRASKVAVGILPAEEAEPSALERWLSDDADVRDVPEIMAAVSDFLATHEARTVLLVDRIIGCPHEEGVDYPDGQTCPTCPFWARRDRWSGEVIH